MFVSKIVPTVPAIPASHARTEGADAVYLNPFAAPDPERLIVDLEELLARWRAATADLREAC